MQKTAARQLSVRHHPAPPQRQADAISSPQAKHIAQLAAMMNGSPAAVSQRELAEIASTSPLQSAQRKLEATMQGGSTSPLQSAQRKLAATIQGGSGKPVQRVVRYKGVDYDDPKKLWSPDTDAFAYAKANGIAMGEVNTKLKQPGVIYDLENKLAVINEVAKLTPEQLDAAAGREATTEVSLEQNTEAFTNEQTYEVAIDEGAAFLKGGPVELIGTSGLNGCVAVMIECKNKGKTAYFVAHVSSHLAGHLDMVQAEVNRILFTLKEAVGEEIDWTAFTQGSPRNTLLLARSPSESQELFINLRTILAKSGAKMLATQETSVTIDFSGDRASFLGNKAPRSGASPPALDPSNNPDKEHGYGASKADSAHIESLNQAGKEDEAAEELDRIAADVDWKGLSPDERQQENLYQQYALQVGDV